MNEKISDSIAIKKEESAKSEDINKHQLIFELIICVANKYSANLIQTLRPLGISPLLARILYLLNKSPQGELLVNQIRAQMFDEGSNISRTLNKLMEYQFIEKVRNTEDQRTVNIKLTTKGS